MLKIPGVSAGLLEKLKRFKRKLARRYGVKTFLLFGSRARGDHLENSDVDVLVVGEGFRGISFPRRLSDVSELWMDVPSIEALCYAPEEFARLKNQSYVVRAAVREGISV